MGTQLSHPTQSSYRLRGCFPVSPRRNGDWASTSLPILGSFFTALQNSTIESRAKPDPVKLILPI